MLGRAFWQNLKEVLESKFMNPLRYECIMVWYYIKSKKISSVVPALRYYNKNL